VIRSFRHKGLRQLYEENQPRLIRPDLVTRVSEIITFLDQVTRPQGMNLPAYRLHPLKGDRQGFWAVTVRANWRITFRFEDGDAWDVDLVDYH
jgi:proteic killer suppression protein